MCAPLPKKEERDDRRNAAGYGITSALSLVLAGRGAAEPRNA